MRKHTIIILVLFLVLSTWNIHLPLESQEDGTTSFPEITRLSILRAHGNFQVIANGNIEIPKIAFPIPQAFADQAPIYFEIFTKPRDALKEVVITARNEYNSIAEVTFHPLKSGSKVEVAWNGYVLIRDHDYTQLPDYAEIPKKSELPEEVCCWLSSTKCVQADHPDITEAAAEIRESSKNVMEIARKTAKFLQTIKKEKKGLPRALDAVTALHKGGTCTSYANLAAALLRAHGIPTRILAGYPIRASYMQTHYLVEFFVLEYGWVRFESSLGEIPWEPYHDVIVAVVLHEDEDLSFQQPREIMPGVPYLSLTEVVGDPEKLSLKGLVYPQLNCDHKAEGVHDFSGENGEAFALTWDVWSSYLELKIRGEENIQALAYQKTAVNSRSVEEYIQKMNKAKAIYARIISKKEKEEEKGEKSSEDHGVCDFSVI